MKRACVIGWPISHSRSPLIHGHWIRTYGLDADYSRVPVRPEELRGFLMGLEENGYVGCNVTIPHKEQAFAMVEPADDRTVRLQAVNTVYVREGRLLGTNTDAEGFVQSLRSQIHGLALANQRAVRLGAGGAAASIAAALLDEGMTEIAVVNRSPERSHALRQRLGNRLLPVPWEDRSATLEGCSLLVNTTSLGMSGQPPLEIDLHRLSYGAIVSDIVYSPLDTALLQQARHRGLRTAEGLGMLLHQAVRGFELWFGVRPEVTPSLYDIVARDIDPDYAP